MSKLNLLQTAMSSNASKTVEALARRNGGLLSDGEYIAMLKNIIKLKSKRNIWLYSTLV